MIWKDIEIDKKKNIVKSEEIGLTLYTKKSVGWPEGDELGKKELIKGIKTKKYKYTYTAKEISEEELIRLIENKQLEVSKTNMNTIDDSMFSKIREGLKEDRSPRSELQPLPQRIRKGSL